MGHRGTHETQRYTRGLEIHMGHRCTHGAPRYTLPWFPPLYSFIFLYFPPSHVLPASSHLHLILLLPYPPLQHHPPSPSSSSFSPPLLSFSSPQSPRRQVSYDVLSMEFCVWLSSHFPRPGHYSNGFGIAFRFGSFLMRSCLLFLPRWCCSLVIIIFFIFLSFCGFFSFFPVVLSIPLFFSIPLLFLISSSFTRFFFFY